jgi:hypothetical protein
MKKILIMAGAASFSVLTHAAPAQSVPEEFSYSFIEANYVDMRNDNLDDRRLNRGRGDIDGLRIKGSVDVAPSFSVIGSLLDAGDKNYDLTVLTIGAAYHQPLPKIENMPFDLVVSAELEHIEVDYDRPKGSDKENGLLLSGGVRLAIIENLQAFSDLTVSTNDYYRDISLSVGARYEFIPGLQATTSIEVGDIDLVSLGLRYNF